MQKLEATIVHDFINRRSLSYSKVINVNMLDVEKSKKAFIMRNKDDKDENDKLSKDKKITNIHDYEEMNQLFIDYKVDKTIKKETTLSNLSDHFLIPYININSELVFCSPKYYNIIKNVKYIDMGLIANLTDRRNLVSTDTYRGVLMVKNDEDFNLKEEDPKTFEIQNYVSKIINPLPKYVTSNEKIIEKLNTLVLYAPIYEQSKINSYFDEFATIKLKPITYTNETHTSITEKANVVKLPYELRKKIAHISQEFENIKDKLKLNKETGYYHYEFMDGDKKISFPILCRHEYMIYDGKSMPEISIECHLEGKCKYCGNDMISYDVVVHEVLPTVFYSIIYSFVNTFGEAPDEEGLFKFLLSLFMNELQNHRKVYSDETKLITLTYLFYGHIHYISKKYVKYVPTEFRLFEERLVENVSKIGMSKKDMNEIISTNKLFKNTDEIPSMLRAYVYKSTGEYSTAFPVSTMFNDNVTSKRLKEKDLNPDNVIQDSWLKNLDLIKELNSNNYKTLISKYVYDGYINAIKPVTSIKLDENLLLIDNLYDDTGVKFFKSVHKFYCPATNDIHKFKDNKCENCGLEASGKNIEDVYKKYEENIIDYVVLKSEESANAKYNVTISKIDLTKYTKIDDMQLTRLINNDYDVNAIKKSLIEMNDHHRSVLHEFIKTLLISNIDEVEAFINKSKDNLALVFTYIINEKVVSNETLMNFLNNVFLDSTNFILLFLN